MKRVSFPSHFTDIFIISSGIGLWCKLLDQSNDQRSNQFFNERVHLCTFDL